MKLLFITRKYPPMVGGMENLSFALAKEFKRNVDTTLIKWGKSQKYLPFFLPLFLVKALYLIPVKKIDHIHIGDGLLSPLGLLLKLIFRIKTTITIVGLDVTFDFPGYQFIVTRCISGLDKVICISQATMDECTKRGIPKEKCIVIPCGVYPEKFQINASRDDLEKIVGTKLNGKKVIITVGRLVERKGVYWFVKNVFPKLIKNTIYLIIGEGPEKEKIQVLIDKLNFKDRIFLLGKISDEKIKIIYNTSDLFIMPNIKIPGTIEGFGIVAIEASSTGLPVVAADIEGITAAVKNGVTGILVESRNAEEFKKAIEGKKLNRNKVSKSTKQIYSWIEIGKSYTSVFYS